MSHQDPRISDPRISSMYRRDCAAAMLAVAVVWLIYAFTFWTMKPFFDAVGLTTTMAGLGLCVMLLNTAAIVAMIRHYSEDRAAIYGIDIYYLDQIRVVRDSRKGNP